MFFFLHFVNEFLLSLFGEWRGCSHLLICIKGPVAHTFLPIIIVYDGGAASGVGD